MQVSIRWWTVLAVNGLVIAVSLVQGWIAQDVAGEVVEERIAKEMSGSVSMFLADKSFPLSNTMMSHLRDILNEDWVATFGDEFEVLGSSLSELHTREFHDQIRAMGNAGTVTLGGSLYRVDSSALPPSHGAGGAPKAMEPSKRLYVLIPVTKLQDARNRASWRVASAVLPSTIVATLVAFFLSLGITQPIRNLAHEMDRLEVSDSGDNHSPARTAPGQPEPPDAPDAHRRKSFVSTGPREVRQLAASFYRLLDRFSATRQRLIQSDRLATLGKLCLSVAHELRNPLSGIKMNMRVLQDRMNPGGDPGVEAILREIDRMGLYLDELMSLAPGSQVPGKSLERSSAKLSEIAESVLGILAGRCSHAKIKIVKNFSSDEPMVHVVTNQIRQAMMNLMVNAIEAMPHGGTLTLVVRSKRDSIEFQAGDTGCGVQAASKNIFRGFFTNKPNGAGLGLYLSDQIIRQHDGRIGYESTAHGANFWFELPLPAKS